MKGRSSQFESDDQPRWLRSFRLGALSSGAVVPLPLYANQEEIAALILGNDARHWPFLQRELQRQGLQPSALLNERWYLPRVIGFLDHRERGPRAGRSEDGDIYDRDGGEHFGK
jgi:hypothetical protein